MLKILKKLQEKIRAINNNTNPEVEKTIFYLNVIWIFNAFVLLAWGINGDNERVTSALLFILYEFLFFWWLGSREKNKQYLSQGPTGDKALGQYGHQHSNNVR